MNDVIKAQRASNSGLLAPRAIQQQPIDYTLWKNETTYLVWEACCTWGRVSSIDQISRSDTMLSHHELSQRLKSIENDKFNYLIYIIRVTEQSRLAVLIVNIFTFWSVQHIKIVGCSLHQMGDWCRWGAGAVDEGGSHTLSLIIDTIFGLTHFTSYGLCLLCISIIIVLYFSKWRKAHLYATLSLYLYLSLSIHSFISLSLIHSSKQLKWYWNTQLLCMCMHPHSMLSLVLVH